ncbi:MAG: acylphosphatase [Clostridiales bacterium]|nr:acylphosphatase [Clostridiales bacterium]
MDKVRRHYIFKGSVQGVGFRYRATYAASMYGVTGWVCNRYDGSVEMETQGMPEAIDKMIAVLRRDRYIYIEDMNVKEIPLEEDTGFHVRSSW